MKKLNLLLLTLIICFFSKAEIIEPEILVDERIELISLISRLAEFEEYVNNDFPEYVDIIDEYFNSFKKT